jgi:hypothetical protein
MRKLYTQGRRANLKKIAREEALKVVKKQSETKTSSFSQENVQLYHNGLHFHNNLLYTTNGSESGDAPGIVAMRIGDELYLQSLRLKMWFSNKNDRPNVIYRVLLYWYDVQVPPSTVSEIFNSSGNLLLQTPNRENITVVADKYIRNVRDSDGTTKEHSTLKFINKNWKGRKIVYNDTFGSTVPKDRSLAFAVMCYDAYGTLITDNIASAPAVLPPCKVNIN